VSKNIVIFLISLLITLLCLEFTLRLTWNNHEWWHQRAGTKQYIYPQNKYGFRDYEYTKDKPGNTVRIICFGDSFTFGGGIKFDDSYPKRLERSLNVKYSPLTGKKYEVLNISWPGYSSFQEINKLDLIKDFKPDLLILGYCLNDTEDWAKKKDLMALRFKTILRKEPNDFLNGLFSKSYFVSFVANRLSNIKIILGTTKYYNSLYEDSYSGWKKTSEAFKILGMQEIPVVIAIFPLLSYSFEKYPFLDIHTKIITELNKNNLPYIDFYDFFKNEDYIRMQVKPYKDPHPSEIATRIIEEHLFEKLTQEYKNILAGDS